MRILQNTLFFAVLLLTSISARAASGWDASFSSQVIDLKGKKVLVVAGSDDAETRAATEAYIKASRAAASLLLDKSTAGDQTGKSDPDILAATQTVPVDIRIIVRAFAGDPASAVLTIYDKKGQVMNAVNVKKGLAVQDGGGTGGIALQGASTKAIDSIANVSDGLKPKVKEYLDRFLHLGQDIYINSASGAVVGQNDVVYKGLYSKRLTNKEFYQELEDENINQAVEQYKRGTLIIGSIVTVGGSAMLLGGIGLAWFGESSSTLGASHTWFTLGGTLTSLLGGITALFGASQMVKSLFGDPSIFKPEELRKTIEQHNIKLKKELGLEDVNLPLGI